MAVIPVESPGKAFLAQAQKSQKCEFLFTLSFPWSYVLDIIYVADIQFSYLFFSISKLSGLGLSGSMGFQLASLTSVTDL